MAEKRGKRRGHGGGGGEMVVPSMLEILGVEAGEMTTGGVGANSTLTANIRVRLE